MQLSALEESRRHDDAIRRNGVHAKLSSRFPGRAREANLVGAVPCLALGYEFACQQAFETSENSSLSKSVPFGSVSLSSTWFFSHAPFCPGFPGSQQKMQQHLPPSNPSLFWRSPGTRFPRSLRIISKTSGKDPSQWASMI